MQDLKITLIQSPVHWENIELNIEMFSRKISSLDEKTDLVVLPEMFSTGFTMNAPNLAEDMEGRTMQWMHMVAAERGCIVTGSIIIREINNGVKFFNRLIWMKPGGDYLYYNKKHLFRYAHENNYYTAGSKKLIVELNGWKICPAICYDLRFPVWLRNRFNNGGEADYDVLVFVANWPEKRNHSWKTLLQARAMENQCYVAGVNRVGTDGNKFSYSGDSMVVNPLGDIISRTKANDDTIETILLSWQEIAGWRKSFPAWMDSDAFTMR